MEAFNAVKDALLACDAVKIKELYAVDYEDFGIRGEIADKNAILECFKPGGIAIEKFVSEDIRVEEIGAVGIIRGKGYIKGRYTNTFFEHKLLFTDIFIFRESRWQYYRSHSTEIQE